MKNPKKKQKKTAEFKFSYIFLILVFVAGITFLALSLFVPKKSKGDDGDTLSTAINETEKKNKTESDENGSENPENAPKQFEGEKDKTDKGTIDAEIAVNDVSDGKYTLQVSIYELLNEGTCKLHMETKNGDTVDRSAKIVTIGPDSSSCDGFEISTSGISSGTYNFTVTMTSGDKTGSVKGTIKI